MIEYTRAARTADEHVILDGAEAEAQRHRETDTTSEIQTQRNGQREHETTESVQAADEMEKKYRKMKKRNTHSGRGIMKRKKLSIGNDTSLKWHLILNCI